MNYQKAYEKVYIKTEADLPKEEGDYFVAEKNYKYLYLLSYNAYIYTQGVWLRDIDWYLQPIAQPELIVPSEEDIKRACPQSIIQRISCWIQGAKWAIEQIKKLNER